jgi:drug/metabolite transporter (DMT)-like permease
VGTGEVEAIISSLLLGSSVVIATYLLYSNDLTVLSGIQLIYSGAIVLAFSAALGLVRWPDAGGWALLLVMGLMPAVGLWTYNAGLPKIGASLTSVLFALCGVMTIGVQVLVLEIFPDADLQLPRSVLLAVVGGFVAFSGVCLLNLGRKDVKDTAGKM